MNKMEINKVLITNQMVFLFDTNIWIQLMSSCFKFSDNEKISGKISSLFEKIVQEEAKIVMPSTVVSELFNRFMHNEHELLALKKGGIQNYSYKRDFRPSKEGIDRKIFFIKQLKNYFEEFNINKVSDCFELINDSDIFEEDRAEYDFNDSLLIRLCETKEYIFVSADNDCKNYKDVNFNVILIN